MISILDFPKIDPFPNDSWLNLYEKNSILKWSKKMKNEKIKLEILIKRNKERT